MLEFLFFENNLLVLFWKYLIVPLLEQSRRQPSPIVQLSMLARSEEIKIKTSKKSVLQAGKA